MSNHQQMRVIDCFYQPSSIFALYDYTKIIYPIDGYICMRQIFTPDSKPSFIKMEHQFEKMHSIYAYPSLMVTLEQNYKRQFMIGFYDSIHFHTKLGSILAEQIKKIQQTETNQNSLSEELKIKIKYSNQNMYVLLSLRGKRSSIQSKSNSKQVNKETISFQNQQMNDNELIVVNIRTKRIVSRNFFPGNVKQLFIKDSQAFTILQEDSTLTQYQLFQNIQAKQSFQTLYMMKKQQIQLCNPKGKNQILSHIWIKQELITVNQTLHQVEVFVQNKKVQSISLSAIKNFQIIYPLMCGFLLANQNFLFVYKKVQLSYVCLAQFFVRQIGFSRQLLLSPQEDILAYFMTSLSSIKYINNFNDQVQHQMGSFKRLAKQLKSSGHIQFKKDQGLKLHVNKQNNTFSISHQSTVQLYSLMNFQCYLEQSIQSQEVQTNSLVLKSFPKKTSSMRAALGCPQNVSRLQTILNVAVHPFSEVMVVALKSKVRVYQVLYNQLNHLKEIHVSNSSEMFFSNSGQFLSIVVSGKNGSKCYIYKTNQDYQLLQCLSIGKKVQKFIWTKYDNFLYGVHSSGYYRWSIQTALKSRYQTLFDVTFKITDAILNDYKDSIVLYGQNSILQVSQKMDRQNQLNRKDVIRLSKTIKQIVFQNGFYFTNILQQASHNVQTQIIVKSQQLFGIEGLVAQCCNQNGNAARSLKNLPVYRQNTGQRQNYRMVPCSGNCKQNIIFLVQQNHQNIKIIEWGKSSNIQNAKMLKNSDLIKIDRKCLKKLFRNYTKYQAQLKKLQHNLQETIEHMKRQLQTKQNQKHVSFMQQIKSMQVKYQQIKAQKQKLQHTIQQKIDKHEQKTIKQVKQLQKIYERKIAITTNKLLTSEQINYRNTLIAEDNLKKLERSANNDVEIIRGWYKKQLTDYMNQKDTLKEQILGLKKEYETRLYELEQENQKILQQHQSKSQESVQGLRRNLVNWQIKFSQAISKKDNIQKSLRQQLINSEILKEKIVYLQAKNREANKKCQYLHFDIEKYEKMLEEKNTSICIYEERVSDLEKSNQILKYRVVELKGETQPQGEENEKLKENLNELQEEYDKIVKSAFEKEQMLVLVRKQNQKSKQTMQKHCSKVRKVEKSYLELLDKVHSITKAPIQQIRKQLINLLNSTKQDEKYLNRPAESFPRSQSPLGELNRIRQHLQICLNEAVDSSNKGEQQKKVQLMKKNRQNSELIKQINDLRRKVRQFQGTVKEKDLQINRILRRDPITVNQIVSVGKTQAEKEFSRQPKEYENQTQYASLSHNQNNSRQQSGSQTRKHTRQTKQSFFEKSLFKSGLHWREKRLKTEQSQHRQAYSRSVKRNNSGKFLRIQNGPTKQDIQDYKRIIEQKQTIIKQLINKIQTLS